MEYRTSWSHHFLTLKRMISFYKLTSCCCTLYSVQYKFNLTLASYYEFSVIVQFYRVPEANLIVQDFTISVSGGSFLITKLFGLIFTPLLSLSICMVFISWKQYGMPKNRKKRKRRKNDRNRSHFRKFCRVWIRVHVGFVSNKIGRYRVTYSLLIYYVKLFNILD